VEEKIEEKTLVRATLPQLASARETPEEGQLSLFSATEVLETTIEEKTLVRGALPQLASVRQTPEEGAELSLVSAVETRQDDEQSGALVSARERPPPPTGFLRLMLDLEFMQFVNAFFNTRLDNSLDIPNTTMFTVRVVNRAALERCNPEEELRVIRRQSYIRARDMLGGNFAYLTGLPFLLAVFSDDDP